MKIKKIISCFLALILLIGAVGCTAASPQQSDSQQQESQPQKPPAIEAAQKTLVIYFSATGSTKAVAETIAETLEADIDEIIPEQPYTSEDLNWRDETSRVNAEHEDADFRPAIAGDIKDLSAYDTIFIGYPIWWGEAPNIVWNFVESYDFSGKTMIPFCTSSSSGLGSSGETLAALAPDAEWLEGQRFPSNASAEDVVNWVKGFELNP